MTSNGKVALITGAGSGMGRLAAINFVAQGWTVVGLDNSETGLAGTHASAPALHARVVDVTDQEAVQQVVEASERELGPITKLYHCAAIMPYRKALEQDVCLQQRIMNINYNGMLNVVHAVLPRMIARKQGDCVVFASMAGLVPTMKTSAYSASKAAVLMYMEILYHENRNSGVRFACVCPPAVDTPLLEQGREAWPKVLDHGKTMQPQEVLDAITEALDRGTFLVIPQRLAYVGYLLRRFLPAVYWRNVHEVEGF